MFSNKIAIILRKISLLLLISIFLKSCGGFIKRADVKDVPINDQDKRAKNIKEGKGITIGGGKKGSGRFDFATSNVMWRATIDILDFVPLATADYGGGVIITDWYSENMDSNESIKIMINFLSNEIRADGLKIKVYKKICDSNNLKCNTQLMSSSLENEIKVAVLKKAAQLQTQDRKKRAEETEFISEPKKPNKK
tara:strand:+ start:166 stop:750 length:585 start_codon:yes stop_codon:yes gene_type:complete